MRVIVLKDITLTPQCFFVLFLLSLLQQVFNSIPNQIIISINFIINYSIILK